MSATTVSTSPIVLTGNDRKVLEALFDPESSLAQPRAIIDDALASLPGFTSQHLQNLRCREADIIKPLNSQEPGPNIIHKTIEDLDRLINSYPQFAPAYANRAQARRLLLDQRNYTAAADPSTITLIYADLSRAVSLASPPTPSDAVSPFQARLLSSALTHRGYLVHMLVKSGRTASLPATLQGVKEGLEDLASHDFYLAGLYGNEGAKQMAVATNPYAKMCGAIVKEAMRDEVGQKAHFI